MADDNTTGGFGGLLSGTANFFAPGNSTDIDPTTGLTEAQRKQAMWGTFGNLGALPMAAGQKQMPAQRAQYLAQIGNIPDQMQKQMTGMVQQRLYGQQLQDKMRESQRIQGIQENMKNPEWLKNLGLTPEAANVLGASGVANVMQQRLANPLQTQLQQMTINEKQQAIAQRQQAVDAINASDMSDAEKKAALADPLTWAKSQIKATEWVPDWAKDAEGKPILDPNSQKQIPVLRNKATGEVKPAVPGSGVNINMGSGETEEAKALGKAAAEDQVAMITAGKSATNQIAKLNLVQDLLAKTQTGKWQDVKNALTAGAKSLGLSEEQIRSMGGDPNSPATQEAVQKIVNEMTIGMIGKGGFPANNFSDADRNFLEKIFPNIQNQPEANAVALEVLRRVERRKQEAYNSWTDYADNEREAGRKPDYRTWERKFERSKQQDNLFGDISNMIGGQQNNNTQSGGGEINGLKWKF